MIEPSDEESPAPGGDDAAYSRMYDFFKYLTGIALVSIGGVLGLLQGGGPNIRPFAIVGVVCTLGLGGLIAMSMASSMASAPLKGPESVAKLRKSVRGAQTLAILLVTFGLGVFIGAFLLEFP